MPQFPGQNPSPNPVAIRPDFLVSAWSTLLLSDRHKRFQIKLKIINWGTREGWGLFPAKSIEPSRTKSNSRKGLSLFD